MYGTNWRAAVDKRIRRLFLLLFALSLLPCAGFAEHTYESQLLACPLINQYDSRYQGNTYRYMKRDFQAEGCGPSSIANLLSSILGVERQEDMDGVLRDIMWLLPYNHQPSTTEADLRNMERFGRLTSEETPVLAGLFRRFGSSVRVSGEEADGQDLPGLASESGPVLYMARFRLSERWSEVASLCAALYAAGHEEALVGIGHLSVGSRKVDAPFRYRDGHYVSVLIPVKTLMEDGSLYLLDSYPRALPGEKVGRGAYPDYYGLQVTGKETLSASFLLAHLKPEVVRLRLNVDIRRNLQGMEVPDQAGKMQEYLEKIHLFGSGIICVMIP